MGTATLVALVVAMLCFLDFGNLNSLLLSFCLARDRCNGGGVDASFRSFMNSKSEGCAGMHTILRSSKPSLTVPTTPYA
eukprot:1443208-Amphidinium_carterae.1